MRISDWKCEVCPEFIKLPLQFVLDFLHSYTSQTTVKHLSARQVNGIEIPLPPLAEQHRIAAKVDELMTLCDSLEAEREKREATRDRLTTASLCRLTAPDVDEKQFKAHADFAIKVLPELTTRSDQIKVLRQTVLDLAVRGRLVEQDPNDEPASELLERISEEVSNWIKSGKARKPKQFPPLDTETIPFELPRGWGWTQISRIGLLSPRNDAEDTLLASFVPMPSISAGYGVPNDHEPRLWGEIKKGYTHFAEGDVGLAKITPCFENGKSTVFRGLTGAIGSGTTELHIVRPLFVSPDYIVAFLKSPFFMVHRALPGKAALIFRKKYSESR